MSRPVRIEFEFATYHITTRGDRKEDIYEDDEDRALFLKILSNVIDQFNWVCHGYCLMNNHYHLLIETPDANLSKGMRQLNGVYTQSSNRRHQKVGHLFQGRYKAILVDADAYLLELTRYVVLNPVAAGMVKHPSSWEWSSYMAMIGKTNAPNWLEVNGLLAQFNSKLSLAIKQYIEFVNEGIGGKSIWFNLKQQVYLGNDRFIEQAQAKCENLATDINIPKAQRRPPAPSLEEISAKQSNRNKAIVEMYRTGQYSYQDIATYLGLHFTTVGRVVRDGSSK